MGSVSEPWRGRGIRPLPELPSLEEHLSLPPISAIIAVHSLNISLASGLITSSSYLRPGKAMRRCVLLGRAPSLTPTVEVVVVVAVEVEVEVVVESQGVLAS